MLSVLSRWRLALKGTSDDGWEAADLLGVDPLGTLHVFELKYGARTHHSLLQAVAYSLSAATDPDWRAFIDQRRLPTREFVARRIAGVWNKIRSDKSSASTRGSDVEKDRARLAGILSERPQLVDEALRTADEQLSSLDWQGNPFPGIRTGPSVHLHVVLPDSTSVPSVLESEAIELARRNVRVSIWRVGVAFDRVSRRGRLRLAEHPLSYTTPKGHRWEVRWLAPIALRAAIETSPSLGQLGWRVGPLWAAWEDPEGYVHIALRMFEERPEVIVALHVPTIVKDGPSVRSEWKSQYESDRDLISEFLKLHFAALDGADEPPLHQKSKPVRYDSQPPGTDRLLTVNRTGRPALTCRISMPARQADPDDVGRCLARPLRDAIEFVLARRLSGRLKPYLASDGRPLHRTGIA